MPEAAPQNSDSRLEELKAYVGEQVGMTVEKINKSDGKLEEALSKLEKMAPIEVVNQLRDLAKSIESRVDDIEAGGIALPNRPDSQQSELRKALESSECLKRLQQEEPLLGPVGRNGVKIPSLLKMDLAKVDIDSSSMARPRSYRSGLVSHFVEEGLIANQVPSFEVTDLRHYFMQERAISAEGGVVTTVDGAIVADAGAVLTLADDGSVNRVVVGSNVLIERTSGGIFVGYYRAKVQGFNTTTRVLTMDADIDVDISDGDQITIQRYSAVAEGQAKPYTTINTVEEFVDLVMIPIMAKITRQASLTNPGLERFLKTRMAGTVLRNLSRQMYYGGGGTTEVQGLLSAARRQQCAWSDGVSGDTMAECVMRAKNLVLGGKPVLNLHGTSFLKIVGEKASDGHFVHGKDTPIAVINTPNLKSVGSCLVNEDPMIEVDDFLIHVPGVASEILRLKGSAQFITGYMNDDIEKNIRRARYEEGLAQAVLSYQAYAHGKFDSQPA